MAQTEVLVVGAGPTGDPSLPSSLKTWASPFRVIDNAPAPGRPRGRLAVQCPDPGVLSPAGPCRSAVGAAGDSSGPIVMRWAAASERPASCSATLGTAAVALPVRPDPSRRTIHERLLIDQLRWQSGVAVERNTELELVLDDAGRQSRAMPTLTSWRGPRGVGRGDLSRRLRRRALDGARGARDRRSRAGPTPHSSTSPTSMALVRSSNGELHVGLDEADFWRCFRWQG